MRIPLRLCLVALLAASCNATETFNPVECVPGTLRYELHPESVSLVFGTVGEVTVSSDDRCIYRSVPASDVEATIRDPSIASFADPSEVSRFGNPERVAALMPESPGRTHLVLRVDGWVDSVPLVVPDTVEITSLVTITAAASTSCGVTGASTLMCWGYNGGAQLAPYDDEVVGWCWGAPCSPIPVPRMENVANAWVGQSHSCAVDLAGDGWCWGYNGFYQVNETTTQSFEAPVPVSSDRTFSEVRPGRRHTCGLTVDGEVECWGWNEVGQVGTGVAASLNPTPALVGSEHTWVDLGVSEDSSCGVTDLGELLCWGYLAEERVTIPGSEECSITTSGKSGTSERTVRCARTPFGPPHAAEMGDDTIFVAVDGVCALTTTGAVGCYDQATGRVEPVGGGAAFAQISSAVNRACALTAGGEAWCWGEGRLGDGTGNGSVTPTRVSGTHVFTQIAVGDRHSCAVTVEEEAWCWGWNDSGQAGASILDEPLEPTRVRGQG